MCLLNSIGLGTKSASCPMRVPQPPAKMISLVVSPFIALFFYINCLYFHLNFKLFKRLIKMIVDRCKNILFIRVDLNDSSLDVS